MAAKTTSGNRYSALVAAIFQKGYKAGIQSFGFSRDDIARTAEELGIALPKNVKDQHGVVQTAQDVAWCRSRLPELICRPVSVQFVSDTKIAMFALGERDGVIGVVDEKHYELVPAASITQDDLRGYDAAAER